MTLHTPDTLALLRPVPGMLLVLLLLLLAACGTQTTQREQDAASSAGSSAAQPADDTTTASDSNPPPGGAEAVAVTSELLDAEASLVIGEAAPDFAYTLADGTTYTLSGLQGKKVLINFWGIGCPPCLHEMPDIQRVSERYADEGFVVLAVNGWQQGAEDIESFVAENDLTFQFITNTTGDIGDVYQVPGLPASFFINSDGTLHDKKVGVMDEAFITEQLAAMH